ncbi:hypothetical protein LINPERHAP1_LOCUS3724 [Linum perenne]
MENHCFFVKGLPWNPRSMRPLLLKKEQKGSKDEAETRFSPFFSLEFKIALKSPRMSHGSSVS